MHRGDRNQHVGDDAQRGDAGEKTKNEAEAPEELGANGKKSQRGGDTHLLREESHSAVKAVASKPAQHFLRAVREEHHAEHEPDNGESQIVGRCEQLADHNQPLLSDIYGLSPALNSAQGLPLMSFRIGSCHSNSGCSLRNLSAMKSSPQGCPALACSVMLRAMVLSAACAVTAPMGAYGGSAHTGSPVGELSPWPHRPRRLRSSLPS